MVLHRSPKSQNAGSIPAALVDTKWIGIRIFLGIRVYSVTKLVHFYYSAHWRKN